jgi:hypothetical protein
MHNMRHSEAHPHILRDAKHQIEKGDRVGTPTDSEQCKPRRLEQPL